MDWLNWIKSNQEVLGLMGAGVAAVVAASWAVFTWKHPKPKDDKPATPPTQSATANNGGIAVNVAGENNQIHIGK
jgi:hypothetical protein